MEITTKEGKINLETLRTKLEELFTNAEKSNAGNLAAGRRFRLGTFKLSKDFAEMRTATPKMK